ncbi:family S53 protease [Mycena epipterygia]|nr:family S53 protease [Mycena epipterygia]
MIPAITVILSFFLAVRAMASRPMVVHEARAEPARGFVDSGIAPAATELTLRIGLRPNNITGLEAALYAVSDPASPLYGQHLTAEEVSQFVRPTEQTVSAVSEWLLENGISSKAIAHAGETLQIVIPVVKANQILSTQFSVFTHVETGITSIRTLEYSIPSTLFHHIDFVHPTTSFTCPLTQPKFTAIRTARRDSANAAKNAVPASCATRVTPACLQALYNITSAAATQTTNKLAVSGFIEQWANMLDLRQFLTEFRPDMNPGTTFALQVLDGGTNPQTPRSVAGVEANLDIQYTVGIATGVPITFVSVGPNNVDGVAGFMDLINALIAEPAGIRPNVLTTSYGFNEDAISRGIASALCMSYLHLGALGTSILFSSGNGGVSGTQPQTCTTFVPTFPSDCPYVTSVGGTSGIVETAVNFSSGGFSNYFATPSYQAADVATYLKFLGATNSGKFNRSGRGFPDVSAQAVNIPIVLDAEVEEGNNGTSFSAPIFAAIIALLNDALASSGKPPLGFLNPLLYSAAGRAALNDIKTGNNLGCNTSGFPATTGWDPVTGLGTPNYSRLMALLLPFPSPSAQKD